MARWTDEQREALYGHEAVREMTSYIEELAIARGWDDVQQMVNGTYCPPASADPAREVPMAKLEPVQAQTPFLHGTGHSGHHSAARLTVDDVLDIRRRWFEEREDIGPLLWARREVALMAERGIIRSATTIYCVVVFDTWPGVGEEYRKEKAA